jgi:predicted metal-dependent phosphoesterase TrpH
MAGAVDLHAHTTASDGALSPRELVREAARRGLRVLAVTDHDSTDGLPDALEEASRLPPLRIVPGLEINCDVAPPPGGRASEIHVLGYCVDWQAAWFQDFLREQRTERAARIHRLAERLGELGMPIDPAEVFALVKEGAAGRPHVAQVMVRRGYVRSVREAFDRYLHAGGPASVPRRRLAPADAVAVIRRAGGVPVLAHPGLADRDDLIPDLVGAGLMGIECWYSEHSAMQTAHYLDMCRRWDLVPTGGSDFHGAQSGHASTLGSPALGMEVWERLRARAERARVAAAEPSGAAEPPASAEPRA